MLRKCYSSKKITSLKCHMSHFQMSIFLSEAVPINSLFLGSSGTLFIINNVDFVKLFRTFLFSLRRSKQKWLRSFRNPYRMSKTAPEVFTKILPRQYRRKWFAIFNTISSLCLSTEPWTKKKKEKNSWKKERAENQVDLCFT